MRILLFCLLNCLNLLSAFAQETLDEKMKRYAMVKSAGNFFVHFDKNVYANNETAYFTGYIILKGKLPTNAHKVMAVALIREVDSALIADDKFIMNDGLSFGSLKLPDSIPTGNYRFLVYTDMMVNQMPDLLFTQNITVKSNIAPPFKANIKLLETGNEATKFNRILVSTSTTDDRFLTKKTQISYRYGGIKKSTVTDASGQTIINLPAQTALSDPNLYVKLKHNNDSTFVTMDIPQPKGKAVVKFYPEGGNLINELRSIVAWEVKDQKNSPIALKAFLLKNREVIDTIETSSYGIGKFALKPEAGANYTIKLIHSNLIDTSYQLPKVISNGLGLTLANAFVKDTLNIHLKSTEKLNITLLVHNFKETFTTFPFLMKAGNSLLKLPLLNLPKGLATVTILDSLNRPLAERMFFAHFDEAEKLTISTDQQTYKQRAKVTLKLNLNDDKNALVSIAAVQNNRLELKKMNDIESFTYLNNELINLPINHIGRPFKDREYLEQVLLVKGWRRYIWQDLQNTTFVEEKFTLDSLQIIGRVTKAKKELTTPSSIGAFGDNKLRLVNTSNKGIADLNSLEMILDQSLKAYLFVNEKNKYAYKIHVEDGFLAMNTKLAKAKLSDEIVLPSTLPNNLDLVLKGNDKIIKLKEVVIKSNTDNSFKYGGGIGSNRCGDYVCQYNILNCRNHVNAIGNKQPVKGVSYNGSNGPYHGCSDAPEENDSFVKFKGIHLPKEFYHDDYKDPNEPAFFSTIYWNYGIMLFEKKQTEISFYTSDIIGKFRIIVQGISGRDVIYAEHFFDVK